MLSAWGFLELAPKFQKGSSSDVTNVTPRAWGVPLSDKEKLQKACNVWHWRKG